MRNKKIIQKKNTIFVTIKIHNTFKYIKILFHLYGNKGINK